MSHHHAPLWRVWHHDFCVLWSESTKISLSLYFSRLSKPISLSFVSYIECPDHPCCPVQDSLQYVNIFPPLGSWNSGQSTPEMGVLQKWSRKCWIEVVDHPPGLAGYILAKTASPGCCEPSLLQGRIPGSCPACCPPWPPGCFVQSCFLAGHTPACTGVGDNCLTLDSARCKIWICFLALCEVPARPLLQPDQVLQNPSPALQCLGCSPSSSVFSASLQRIPLLLSSVTAATTVCLVKGPSKSKSWRDWPEHDRHCKSKTEGTSLFPLQSRTRLFHGTSNKPSKTSPICTKLPTASITNSF